MFLDSRVRSAVCGPLYPIEARRLFLRIGASLLSLLPLVMAGPIVLAQTAKPTDAGKTSVEGAGSQLAPPRPVTPAAVLPPPASFDVESRDHIILSHLNAVVRYFRLAVTPIQKVGEPSDLLYRDQAVTQATQVADLAFQSSRAEAALLVAFARTAGTQTAAPAEGEAQKLQAVRANIVQRLADLKSQLQAINQHLDTAKAKQRAPLLQQQEETQGDIELYTAMTDSLKQIAVTSEGGANGGLAGDINRLQRSAPELTTVAGKPVVAAPLENLNASRSSGVSSQAVVLFQLLSTRRAIDLWIRENEDLHDQAMQARIPLTQLVRSVVASGQAFSLQTEAQNGVALAATQAKQPVAPLEDAASVRHRYEVITATFNAVSSALVPLTKEIITLEQSRANLMAWRAVVDEEYREILKSLLLHLLGIAVALGVLFLLSGLWQRATNRYVHDIRRRRQLLITRRVIVGFLGGLVVIFGFVTQFNSLATFAGFITAGIAVGLQTILLSVAAYFFIVGRYGVRVGDRITVAGVTGDVIDVGLVRFYLMELAGSGTDLQPTGRVAIFANSVLFQSGTPLYRQLPGAEYGWHELSVKLSLDANYTHTSDELLKLIQTNYGTYKQRIEGQHRQVEAWMDSAIPMPEIESRLQLVEGGLQLYIRYPVELREASQTDQEITRSVVTLMEGDAQVKSSIASAPTIRALKG